MSTLLCLMLLFFYLKKKVKKNYIKKNVDRLLKKLAGQ